MKTLLEDMKVDSFLKVLAVDDSASILQLIKTALEGEGIQVETAANGAEALDKFVKFKPDVVTLDVSMPIMDGLETLNRLLKLDKKAKVVMVTVQEHWSLIERCIEHGAVGYLAKPFNINDLIDTVKDPWSYDDKNAIVLLSLACNKISSALHKVFKVDVSTKATQIEIIRHEEMPNISPNGANVAQVMVVSKMVTEPEINPPKSSIGFVTEFKGQQSGLIISFIKTEDLGLMMPWSFGYFPLETKQEDFGREFFSILHHKIFSSLVDLSHLILSTEVTRLFDESNDKPGQQVVKANLQLGIKELVVPIQTQIWSDLRGAFKRRL